MYGFSAKSSIPTLNILRLLIRRGPTTNVIQTWMSRRYLNYANSTSKKFLHHCVLVLNFASQLGAATSLLLIFDVFLARGTIPSEISETNV